MTSDDGRGPVERAKCLLCSTVSTDSDALNLNPLFFFWNWNKSSKSIINE